MEDSPGSPIPSPQQTQGDVAVGIVMIPRVVCGSRVGSQRGFGESPCQGSQVTPLAALPMRTTDHNTPENDSRLPFQKKGSLGIHFSGLFDQETTGSGHPRCHYPPLFYQGYQNRSTQLAKRWEGQTRRYRVVQSPNHRSSQR
jgi:hypothetical protein